MLRLRVPGEPWTSFPCAHSGPCSCSRVSWPAVCGPITECQLSSCAGLGSQGTQGVVLMQLCSCAAGYSNAGAMLLPLWLVQQVG